MDTHIPIPSMHPVLVNPLSMSSIDALPQEVQLDRRQDEEADQAAGGGGDSGGPRPLHHGGERGEPGPPGCIHTHTAGW